jgi:hypothetical protein
MREEFDDERHESDRPGPDHGHGQDQESPATEAHQGEAAVVESGKPQVEHSEVRVIGVVSVLVPEVWPRVRPLIQSALDKGAGEVSVDDILARLLNAQSQLWMMFDGSDLLAAAVTQIVNFPQQRICEITQLGGRDPERFVPAFAAHIMPGLQRMGVSAIHAHGRRGWNPFLKHLGAKPLYTTFRLEI